MCLYWKPENGRDRKGVYHAGLQVVNKVTRKSKPQLQLTRLNQLQKQFVLEKRGLNHMNKIWQLLFGGSRPLQLPSLIDSLWKMLQQRLRKIKKLLTTWAPIVHLNWHWDSGHLSQCGFKTSPGLSSSCRWWWVCDSWHPAFAQKLKWLSKRVGTYPF